MYLPVGELPLDASGMKLIDSEERMERLARLHPLMLRLLTFDVSAPPSQVKKSQTDSHLNQSLTMGVLGFLLAGWTGLHHSFPLFTAIMRRTVRGYPTACFLDRLFAERPSTFSAHP